MNYTYETISYSKAKYFRYGTLCGQLGITEKKENTFITL